MTDSKRATARELCKKSLNDGSPVRWFEELYALADGDDDLVPWADMEPNLGLLAWLEANPEPAPGKALAIGSGLGDDAEELVRQGYGVTGFDISDTAVKWCKKRYPDSPADYQVQDLFKAPDAWSRAFDFVLELYTLQVLPPELRAKARQCIAGFVKPGGKLLVIARGREDHEDPGQMPWPLTKSEVLGFANAGLKQLSFEDYVDDEEPPVRRFRACFFRPGK
jgi:hypothetical protein